jgi:hypothetical protein
VAFAPVEASNVEMPSTYKYSYDMSETNEAGSRNNQTASLSEGPANPRRRLHWTKPIAVIVVVLAVIGGTGIYAAEHGRSKPDDVKATELGYSFKERVAEACHVDKADLHLDGVYGQGQDTSSGLYTRIIPAEVTFKTTSGQREVINDTETVKQYGPTPDDITCNAQGDPYAYTQQ